jgi:hypothetical protein
LCSETGLFCINKEKPSSVFYFIERVQIGGKTRKLREPVGGKLRITLTKMRELISREIHIGVAGLVTFSPTAEPKGCYDTVMEFPPQWTILTDDIFETTTPRIEGSSTMELLAQVRHTGRILGNFRVALGGEARLKVDVDLGAMLPQDIFRDWRYKTQFWARDVKIRTNMTTSAWLDVTDTVSSKDANIFDDEGSEMSGGEFLRIVSELLENKPHSAAVRWAVTVGEDSLMKLQLQSLPGPAVLVSGKPTLKQ